MWLKRDLMQCVGWILRLLSIKRCSLLKTLVFILLLSLISSLIFLYTVMDSNIRVPKANPPVPHVRCLQDPALQDPALQEPRKHRSDLRLRFSHRALLISETPNSKNGQKIRYFLMSLRIDVKVEPKSRTFPSLSNRKSGRFAVIIFEDYNSYFELESWNRHLIDKYCHDYHIGIIGFVRKPTSSSSSFSVADGYFLTFQYNLKLEDFKLNFNSDIWRITKPGEIWKGHLPDKWAVFHGNHSTYEPLVYSRLSSTFLEFDTDESIDSSFRFVTSILDKGEIDGIPRVLLGSDIDFWFHSMLMMDAMSYLSHGKLQLQLERYIQVDIDDIFVGKEGIRMKIPDVEALVSSQERLEKEVKGFQFNLGFSGGFYLSGNKEEDHGDRRLLVHRHKFRWFSHMYKHEQPHKFSPEYIKNSMILNKNFAEDHDLPVYGLYAVSPHHSGVFPVYEPLYNLWRSVWGVRCTSSEEYPKLMPAWKRRGFIHQGIMVLPRQTCGLFTTTVFASDFKGGIEKIDSSLQGGEVFQTVLITPVSIFMTHLSNYGNDRLALYLLESAVKFLKCWTNLELLSLPPLEMGLKYFDLYPQDREPIWTNPCDYYRHLSIWPSNRTCDQLPHFVIVGPQKTGTTALHYFLSLHPSVMSNKKSEKTFEEIQFFNSDSYHLGLDWYMDFFPVPEKPNTTMLFEKSANYFDNEDVPKRMSALLPRAKIVVLLMNPAMRAYSWYHHVRNHKDATALNYTFYEVISASDASPSVLKGLRNRCLGPGLYSQHLLRWLDYYPPKQIHIVHSDQLINDPVLVMHRLQKFLELKPYLDYSQYLRYDAAKGFFCQAVDDKRTQCLGKSKGHAHPPMDEESQHHLRLFYRKHNINLSKMLPGLSSDIPDWLQKELEAADLHKS